MLQTVPPLSYGSVPPPGTGADEPEALVDSDARFEVKLGKTDGHHLWVHSDSGRAYYLRDLDLTQGGYRQIASVDVASGDQLARQTLTHRAFSTLNNTDWGSGYDNVLALDDTGEHVFLATTFAQLTGEVGGLSRGATEGRPCAGLSFVQSTCLTGVSVLDAETLEQVRHVPLRTLDVQTPILAPQLVAMAYAPPLEGRAAKIHVVVQDAAAATYVGDGVVARWNPRHLHNVSYLIQLDPVSGAQDWIVRLDSCRGASTAPTTKTYAQTANSPHQGAVFRARRPGDTAVYVACFTSTQSYTGAVVRVPLDEQDMATVSVVPSAEELEPEPADPDERPAPVAPRVERPHTVEGPDRVAAFLADPESGRIALQVRDGRPTAMVWYVFDTNVMQFIGTIGIGGPVLHQSTLAGLSADGRLYTFSPEVTAFGHTFAGGLFVADLRGTPVPQALHFPELADSYPVWDPPSQRAWFRYALTPQSLPDGGVRLWMPSRLDSDDRPEYVAVDDLRPAQTLPPVDATARTLDLPEAPGVTEAVFDGTARGYGFRALLIAGAEAAVRAGPADPVGLVAQCHDPGWAQDTSVQLDPWDVMSYGTDVALDRVANDPSERGGPCHRARVTLPAYCLEGSREAVFAFAGPQGPAVVDGTGARGAAEPIFVDSLTTTDASAPVSRCAGVEWDVVWGTALFGRPPAEEPSAVGASERLRLVARCLSASEETSQQTGDGLTRGYSAAVSCQAGEASGHAYTRAVGVEGVTVSEALSSFRVYRDPGRGIVSRVESVARGVNVPGLLRIDTVRGVAESWANGREFTPPVLEEGETYEPNCDFERTAGTCFRRHLFGVSTPGFSCGPCGDEHAFMEGVNAVVNPYMSLRLREPDERLRQGALNGFIAAVQKPEHERFSDLVLNLDLMQTTLPTLEIIRHAPPNRPASRAGARGRQIYQFAGVEVSSSYAIQCLLVYDEATNTCAEASEPPGSLTVSLADLEGKPLAGGAFEVRADVDADGVLGLADTLLAEGACVTAEDGVGTCRFEGLAPGGYLVNQVAAPPGYAKSAEPFVVELASGEARTVAFTNASNVSVIELKAVDEHGSPLAGASFTAYPDPDSDGKVAPEAAPAAECTTDAQGACSMRVPAGSYVLVQTSAPAGLEGIEPVPFTFASGGQVAAVSVVNYPPDSPSQPDAPASPVYTPPVGVAPPVESVTGYVPPLDGVNSPEVAVGPSLPDQIAGTVVQVIRAPGDALRLLSRDPKQAAAWMGALALFALAGLAVRRRAQALALLSN